ncbi:MAG: thioredoxin, partial [Propionibacteriaceae bacterium]|nr:thioredoxin [Propionibacteriaceae bacterium]
MVIVVCVSCGKKNRVPEAAKGLPQCAHCQSKLPWLVNGTDRNFDEVTSASVPVLVDLWAPWCAPCISIAPMLERLSRDRAGQLKIVKVNIDDNPALQERFNAMSIPTMVILKDGEEVARQIGALPQRALQQWV